MQEESERSRHLTWDACYNVRDVGGYPTEAGGSIRWQALVRADDLYRLSPGGQEALRDYGVRTIIDLRLAHELERDPDPFASSPVAGEELREDMPRYLNVPLHDLDTADAMSAAASIQEEYIVLLQRHKPAVATVIEAVAEGLPRGAVLVHCHGGKDRTGIVVALLLSLAGVPRDTIVEDYAISEAMLESPNVAWLEEQARAQGRPVERPRWMYALPETMQGVLEYLDREYGGVEAYLEAAGVTQGIISQIREYLVAPADAE